MDLSRWAWFDSGDEEPLVTTVSLAVMSWCKKDVDIFAQYCEPWWNAIKATSRKPDKVVICHWVPDTAGITSVPDWMPHEDVVTVGFPNGTTTAEMLNGAIANCGTDWIMFIGLDDEILPDALKQVDEADAAGVDILSTGVRFTNGGDWFGSWDVSVLRDRPPLPSNCPMRVRTLLEIGGFAEMKYHDWGMWVKLAKHGATAYQGNTYGMLFHHGERHETQSGIQSSGHDIGRQQVHDLAAEIGWQF
jgi:hypothetical protein